MAINFFKNSVVVRSFGNKRFLMFVLSNQYAKWWKMPLTQNDIKCLYAARKLMLTDLSVHYTIEEIATYVGLSSTKLKKGFKALFKKAVFEYLETERLERAKTMMRDSDKPLKQISKAAGFQYLNNFSRAFKNTFGISPNEWRKGLHCILLITGPLSLTPFETLLSLIT